MCIRDRNILVQYQTIYDAKNGVAVAEILDGSCGECGSFIPPQLVNEALEKQVVFCGNCGLFVYQSISEN